MVGTTHVGGDGQVIYLGTGTSFDVSHIPGYQNLTTDNFLLVITRLKATTIAKSEKNSGQITPSKTYNSTTGILTVSIPSAYAGGAYSIDDIGNNAHYTGVATALFAVYLVTGKIKQI